jgi:hypothetical protein
MSTTRPHLRSSLIALAAIWGVSLTGVVEAATGGQCPPSPISRPCCVVHPERCNDCCPPSGALAIDLGDSQGLKASGIALISEGQCRLAACRCSSNEPATPSPKPDRRTTAEGPSDLQASIPPEWLGHHLSQTPAVLVPSDAIGRLHRPLYLLTTHLLF